MQNKPYTFWVIFVLVCESRRLVQKTNLLRRSFWTTPLILKKRVQLHPDLQHVSYAAVHLSGWWTNMKISALTVAICDDYLRDI